MNFLVTNHHLAGRIIDALCWMLLHSLWQGLLLAVIAGLIILCTKKHSSSLRYNLLCFSAIAFTVASAFTFVLRLVSNADAANSNSLKTVVTPLLESSASTLAAKADPGILEKLALFFNQYSTIIVMAWLLVIGFRCVRLISGFYSIQQIRRSGVLPGNEHWIKRTEELCTQLGIKRRVRFLQSGITSIPMVLGHLKPIILFPAGVLTSLSAGEIEAILIHELAHIRRNDYLANIMQSFLEIAFFFNPAVIWVSELIKTERENCCDDIAVARASSKRNYINALLSFQEYNLNVPQHASALARKKDHLLHRVKRIIYNNNKTLNAMEKLVLASGLLVTGILVFAFSTNEPQPHNKTDAVKQVRAQLQPQPVRDTVPPGPTKIITSVGGKEYVMELKDDRIVALSIDGQKIPSDKIADHKAVTDKIMIEMKVQAAKARGMVEEAAQRQAELKIQVEKLQQMQTELGENEAKMLSEDAERKAKELQLVQQNLKQKIEKLQQENSEVMDVNAEKAMALAEKEKEIALLNQLASNDRAKQIAGQNGKNTAQAEQLEKLNRLIEMEHQKLAKLHAEREMIQANLLSSLANTNSMINMMREDLLLNGVIKEGDKFSIKLNSNELLVNGVKQPAALHKKFKEKYVKTPDWNFTYNQ